MKALQSNWIVITLLAMLSYMGTTVALLRPSSIRPPEPVEAEESTEALGPPDATWNYVNPELDQLINDLRSERDALTLREQQLKELTDRLQVERLEIAQVTQSVRALQLEFEQKAQKARADFETNLVRVTEEETLNLKKLAKVYASMSPEGAAVILKEMPDEMVVKVFVFMKDSESAPILEAMGKSGPVDAKRAAVISDRLRLTMSRNATKK